MKRNLMLILFLTLLSGMFTTIWGQTTVTIGNNTTVNTVTGSPTPYGTYFKNFRQQYLIFADELTALGVGPGNVTDLAFNVQAINNCVSMPNFRIRMKHTNQTVFTTTFEVGDYQQVWHHPNFLPVVGWNPHTFTTPFLWDGISNIIVDIVTSIIPVAYTQNASVYYSATTGINTALRYQSDSIEADTSTTGTLSVNRANMQLTIQPLDPDFDDDMAAVMISGPTVLNIDIPATYTVTVRNNGANVQNNYTVKLMQQGGIELDSQLVTESLDFFEQTQVQLSWTPTSEGGTSLYGKVVLTGDENPDNDETNPFNVLVVGPPLIGTYSIDSSGTGDFNNFTEAVTYLSNTGAGGPVTFEVEPGVYTERIVIPTILGASETNTVTFIGMGDNPDDVILTYTATDTNNRHIVKLDGANHVRFDNLKFEIGVAATHGWVFHITNGSENIEIVNCHLQTVDTATSAFYGGIIVSASATAATTAGNNVNGLLVENNVIEGGYYGLTLIGATGTPLQNARIIGNTILNAYYYGLYVNYNAQPLITENHIDMRSTGTTTAFGAGIYNLNAAGPFEFSRNRIINPGQYGIYTSGSNSPNEPSLIANNMIGGGFRNTGTTASGIYLTTSSNVGIHYNSINNDSTTGRGFYTLATATNLDIRNNSFVFSGSGAGYAVYHSSTASIQAHDYNNYYSGTSQNFVYYGAAVANLTALQQVNTPQGNDQNSLDIDPLYVNQFDLDIQPASQLIGAGTPIASVNVDFHGNPRHPEFPTIGAHEFDVSGFGSLDGYVYDQATNNPLSGALVVVNNTNYQATTDNNGYFIMPFVFNGTYSVSASIFGYNTQTIDNVVIIEDENTNITFNLEQLSNVTVSGQVVGSDYPAIGLPDAQVSLTGYHNYNTVTGANGLFSIPGVYNNQTYTISVIVEGYSPYMGEVVVGTGDLDLGVIIVNEVAYPPNTLIATQSADDTYVDLIWNSPLAIDYYFSDFETDNGDWIPTATWDPIGDWEWSNVYNVNNWFLAPGGSTSATPPPAAYSGTGLWGTVVFSNHTNSGGFSYLTQTFDFSAYNDALLNFWSWNDSFGSFDYGQIRVNGNIVWGPAWNYQNTQWQEVTIDLSAYDGLSQVEIVFEHYATTVVNYAGWYIDDVYIGPEASYPPMRDYDSYVRGNDKRLEMNQLRNDSNRIIENYRVYRFLYADQNNPDNWNYIASPADTTYTDLTWNNVASGFYRYAVRAEYTNDVLSEAAISNWVGKDMTTNVTINITTNVGDSAAGAVATLHYMNQDPDGNSPTYNATAVGDDPAVATLLNVLRGNYNIQVTKPGYSTYTQTNVSIQTPTTIDVVLNEMPYPPVNLVYTAGNNLVSLSWDPPVPTTRTAEFDYDAIYEELRASGITDKEELGTIINQIIDWENSSNVTLNNRALLGYNVYRDGNQINTNLIVDTVFNDTTVENNVTYVFYVTAVYTLSESVPSNSVTVVPGPNQLIQIGDGITMGYHLPFNFFYKCSLTQTIYMEDELNIAGLITQIRYYNNFTTNLANMPIQIWMGETTQDNLSAGWIPSTQLDLVFSGTVNFPSGQNVISIELDDFFFYTGSGNLVVMAKRNMDTQYYSSLDRFYYTATPQYPGRSRHMFSDTIDYDHTAPTGGTLSANVPNSGIYFVTVGMGSLDGYVYDQNNQPIQGTMITVAQTDFVANTNSQGYYLFPYMFEGTHTVTASKFGYYDGVEENVLVEEYETTSVNFNLTPLPTVTVSGRIVGSDQPDVGLDNAFISLDGYNYYEVNGNVDGTFSITGVYADHTYTMTVQRGGYSTLTQDVAVGNTNLDLGDVVVNELAFPPFDVTATIAPDNMSADIEWVSPDEYDFIDFRYDDGVPTAAIGIPTGTNNTIIGAVQRRSAVLNSVSWYTGGATNHPTVNLFIFGLNAQGLPNSNAVLYQANNVTNYHQQWTIFELPNDINAPNGFLVGLSVAGNLGLAGDDGVGAPYVYQNNTHYYSENYTTGTWMTMESAGYNNNFLIRAQGFDLGPIRGMEPLAGTRGIVNHTSLQAEPIVLLHSTSTSKISNIRHTSSMRENDRVLIGFIIYRLATGQEQNPDSWDEIGTIPVTETSFTDIELNQLVNGNYRYAVRSVYTNNVLSIAAFSNVINYQEQIPYISNLQVNVQGNDVYLTWQWVSRGMNTRQITLRDKVIEESSDLRGDRAFLGFKITRNGPVIAEGVMEPEYHDAGVPAGTYTYTVIGVHTNGSTNMLYVQATVTTDVDDTVAEPLVTALLGNYPNPFNPETKISYSVESDSRVFIEIYNIRGQYITTLIDDHQNTGRYSVVWNGKDDRGRDAGSGIFFYRMKSGSYSSTKKMILMK